MIWVLFAAIAIGLAWAIVSKVRKSDLSLPAPPQTTTTAIGGPSFGVVFVTVLKVIAAILIIALVVVVGLLLFDQHVHSLTG
jgi:uncharacterized membrane protein